MQERRNVSFLWLMRPVQCLPIHFWWTIIKSRCHPLLKARHLFKYLRSWFISWWRNSVLILVNVNSCSLVFFSFSTLMLGRLSIRVLSLRDLIWTSSKIVSNVGSVVAISLIRCWNSVISKSYLVDRLLFFFFGSLHSPLFIFYKRVF